MSVPPMVPVRSDANSSIRPSLDRLGCWSLAVEFTAAKFSGGDQGSCTLRRVEHHRSRRPAGLMRVDPKKISRPSVRTLAAASLAVTSDSSATSTAEPRVSPFRVIDAT